MAKIREKGGVQAKMPKMAGAFGEIFGSIINVQIVGFCLSFDIVAFGWNE